MIFGSRGYRQYLVLVKMNDRLLTTTYLNYLYIITRGKYRAERGVTSLVDQINKDDSFVQVLVQFT